MPSPRILKAQQEKDQLRQKADAILKKAEAENRYVLTEEEDKEFKAAEAAIGEVESFLARAGALEEWERTAPAPAEQPTARADGRTNGLFKSFGQQLLAVRDHAIGKRTDPRLAMVAAAQGAGEAVDSDGGFLVQQDMSSEILQRMSELGQILQRVREIPVSGNGLRIPGVNETSRATGSRWGGVQGYRIEEGGSPTASRPKFRMIELRLRKYGVLGYASDELLADAPAMGAIYTQAFAEELNFLAEDDVFEGTGANAMLGLLNADCTVQVAKETGQAAATLVPENIAKMWARMWARSRFNAVWLINQDIEPQLHLMTLPVGTGGVPVYMPAGSLSGSPFSTLYGRPVIPVEYCATLGTAGDIVLADLSQYITISKGGIQQAQSMHVAFTTDEMAFRAILRKDGQPIWNSAVTPFKGSNTLSPFVKLATRS